MAKTQQKTKPTKVSVKSFLKKVPSEERRADAFELIAMMREITGLEPKMWGPTMVGFGDYHYVYASGHEGDCFIAGFAPRKTELVVYFMAGLQERFAKQLAKLGKAKAGKGCLHIKRLADVDMAVLREMIRTNIDVLEEMSRPAKKKK